MKKSLTDKNQRIQKLTDERDVMSQKCEQNAKELEGKLAEEQSKASSKDATISWLKCELAEQKAYYDEKAGLYIFFIFSQSTLD